MRKVLLDANILIAALDDTGTSSQQTRDQAKQLLTPLLESDVVTLVITPLIRYEVLRGIIWEDQARFQQLKQVLDRLTELDIDKNVSELAAQLFRFDRSTNSGPARNVEKRKFDVFHLATAKGHCLELLSQDSDIVRLEDLYSRYMQADGSC